MFRRKKWLYLSGMLILSLCLTACGGTNNSEDNKTREFETVKGTIDVPDKPERIVTDYYGGELLSVDANVIGVGPSAFDNPFLTDLLKDVEDVGDPINPEKVLGLEPDLIVVMYDDDYEALSKIALTVYIPYGTTEDIDETVDLFADLTGKKEEAAQYLADFEEKAAEGRDKLKGIIDPEDTFGIYELTNKGELWMFGDNFGRGGQVLYNALHLNMPDKNTGEEGTEQLSMEVLPDYAADYMFLTTYDPENDGEALKDLRESSIWKNLDAAKNDTVFYNDFDTFYPYDPISVQGQIDLFVDMIVDRYNEEQ